MAKRNHEAGKLAAVSLKKLGEGWHADGGNLYLLARGASRTWVFRYTAPDGTRKNMGLGSLNSLSLANARQIAADFRAQVKHPSDPVDPMLARQESRDEIRTAKAKRTTFEQAAIQYIVSMSPEWKNAKHISQWSNTLRDYAYPHFGNLPIDKIDTPLVMKALTPIWLTKTETASRLRGRIESVLDWATTSQYRTGENPARWRGHLDNLLPNRSKVQKVKHHAALSIDEINPFIASLRSQIGHAALALELCILTATRTGEVIGAKWSEIDLKSATWTIPAERMKMRKEHAIPLSTRALEILKSQAKTRNSDYIFSGRKIDKPLSNMAMLELLKRMKRDDLTVHGFRSTFRDWASERTNFDSSVCEMALAHTIGSDAELAYRRGDLFLKRTKLMQAWADYCELEQLKDGSNVMHLQGVA
ncbi:MAG: tyrosine-type recombinase/integrase [Methylotenera sp.]|uniref:tyrosine-type recombinase/integrase n=1 Tax=Methylotenera sp. TaxID=2051956 RepID=UPI0024899467|nr:site-specific integrase [Methylotenera sp.]MDI1309395.1 tyrosine-type recombinase/integrase [Methylotenera sp.]